MLSARRSLSSRRSFLSGAAQGFSRGYLNKSQDCLPHRPVFDLVERAHELGCRLVVYEHRGGRSRLGQLIEEGSNMDP